MPHPLIIDEGFGTQDATGRGKLVEAISSIQDDFQRIIVITHIDKLKDAFPVRIEVTRTNEGSTIDPPITLTITYDPALIPEGVAEENLVIAIWKDGEWVNLDSTVDPVNNAIVAQVEHFTAFTVLAYIHPAAITWPLIGGIIAAIIVLVAGLLIIFLLRWRRGPA